MARGNSRAASELSGFRTYKTGGRRQFDDDSDDGYDADKDARSMGYGSWRDYENQMGVDEERWHYGSDALKGYLKGSDVLKEDLAKLTPEEAKTYKQYRKVAVDAFNTAEEKAKAEWQAANPGKEYEGRPRIAFVSVALKAAADAVQKAYGETDYDGRSKAAKSTTLDEKFSNLALGRLTYEKDAFLRLKGHYEHESSKNLTNRKGKTLKYLHIDNPWFGSYSKYGHEKNNPSRRDDD
jgi:hypothetical protein